MASTPQSRPRRRKVAVLTQAGFQKLQTAQSQSEIWNHYAKTCTLEALSELTGLSTHTLSKVHARKAGVDLRTLVRYFSAFGLALEPSDYTSTEKTEPKAKPEPIAPSSQERILPLQTSPLVVSWGTAPDVSRFYGRVPELATLRSWILEQRCRLITLSGMGGIGKTWLSVKLLEQLQSAFRVIIWRSLRPLSRAQPPLSFDDLLDDLLRHLVPSSDSSFPGTIHDKILQLIDCLQRMPCLLVLDNVESVLKRTDSSSSTGESFTLVHQVGYEAYNELFRLVAQGRHQSCLVLTSREEPQKIQSLSGENRQVRLFRLSGLQTPDIKQMFGAKGCFQASDDEWHHLVAYYGGNPFVLETVATTIQKIFDGSVTEFLMYKAPLLDDICELMNQQVGLLSVSEKVVIGTLASQDTPCSLSSLRSQLPASMSATAVLGILKSLGSRSLLEKTTNGSSLPSLPSNYVKDYVREYSGVLFD